MKVRFGFVSNSSSTSFTIWNLSDKKKTLVDFVKENPQLIEKFKQVYNWHASGPNFTQEHLIESARLNNLTFPPKKPRYCIFGDEDGTLVGEVFDYILRDGGESKSFSWKFEEYLR